MTSAIMLAKVRTFLDEASASYWTDTEVYAALAHAQVACIDVVLAVYKQRFQIDPDYELPDELRVLTAFAGAGMSASALALPSGFFWLVSAKWDHDASGLEEPCRIASQNRTFNARENNTYLAATSTDPVAYVGVSAGGVQSINFLPAYDTSATYSIVYLKYPTAIASGQEPTLPEGTHNAIVEYATYAMLMKDQRPQEAQVHFNIYLQEIKNLI